MTILRVHDLQQSLVHDFAKAVKKIWNSPRQEAEKRDQIFFQGQEMGFCNDEINVLLEDLIPAK